MSLAVLKGTAYGLLILANVDIIHSRFLNYQVTKYICSKQSSAIMAVTTCNRFRAARMRRAKAAPCAQ